MDGQSEVAKSIVLNLLKSYVGEVDQKNMWEKYLPLVEYVHNNILHSSTTKVPFEVIEGRIKPPLLLKIHGNIFATTYEYAQDIKDAFQKIREAIEIV